MAAMVAASGSCRSPATAAQAGPGEREPMGKPVPPVRRAAPEPMAARAGPAATAAGSSAGAVPAVSAAAAGTAVRVASVPWAVSAAQAETVVRADQAGPCCSSARRPLAATAAMAAQAAPAVDSAGVQANPASREFLAEPMAPLDPVVRAATAVALRLRAPT